MGKSAEDSQVHTLAVSSLPPSWSVSRLRGGDPAGDFRVLRRPGEAMRAKDGSKLSHQDMGRRLNRPMGMGQSKLTNWIAGFSPFQPQPDLEGFALGSSTAQHLESIKVPALGSKPSGAFQVCKCAGEAWQNRLSVGLATKTQIRNERRAESRHW